MESFRDSACGAAQQAAYDEFANSKPEIPSVEIAPLREKRSSQRLDGGQGWDGVYAMAMAKSSTNTSAHTSISDSAPPGDGSASTSDDKTDSVYQFDFKSLTTYHQSQKEFSSILEPFNKFSLSESKLPEKGNSKFTKDLYHHPIQENKHTQDTSQSFVKDFYELNSKPSFSCLENYISSSMHEQQHLQRITSDYSLLLQKNPYKYMSFEEYSSYLDGDNYPEAYSRAQQKIKCGYLDIDKIEGDGKRDAIS